MSIVRQTELTAATIDPAAEVYNAAFNVRTFYVIRAVWGDVPAEEVDPIQLLKLKQHVYRAICNHEVYGAYLDGSQAPAAIMVLKRPVDENNPPKLAFPRLCSCGMMADMTATSSRHRMTSSWTPVFLQTLPPERKRQAILQLPC